MFATLEELWSPRISVIYFQPNTLSMKLRTITSGVSLMFHDEEERLREAAEFNAAAREMFGDEGYEVQDTRISTNSWEEYTMGLSSEEVVEAIKGIESFCKGAGASFVSIGHVTTAERAEAIPDILAATSTVSTSVRMGDVGSGLLHDEVRMAARAIKRVSEITPEGFGNFSFCGWANCPPGTPFFPTGYHLGPPSFSIGLENSDLAVKAFSEGGNILDGERLFRKLMEETTRGVEEVARRIEEKLGVPYGGLDVSLNPSLVPEESIACAYEAIGMGRFGGPGTLVISAMITSVLKALPVKRCGYSGLMLPVCEDAGLAQRANEDAYGIHDLLLFSAVCGCGLDTIPIPGDTPVKRIEAILLDVTSMALRLDKPLSARLLPVPGKKAGEVAHFGSEYLVDCRIFDV